jgi:hypothetical protein
MDSTPLPVDRHSAATFQPGARVYDQVTRAFGQVVSTAFSQTLKQSAAAQGVQGLPNLFTVPESKVSQVVTVRLENGESIVRLAEQLHNASSAIAAGLVDFNRPKAGG